jgi:hypothetical protein
MHFLHVETGWHILKPTSILLEGNFFGGVNYRRSWNGDAQLQRLGFVDTWLRFRNYWILYFELDYDLTREDNREARDGAIVERTGGWGGSLWFKTDPRRRFVLEGQGAISRVRHGQFLDGFVWFHLRPVPAVELDIGPHATWTYGDPRWFDTRDNLDGSRTYYFAELESREFDVTLRGTYTFTPTLTLQAYAQVYVDGGHYGNTSAAVGSGRGSRLPLSAFRTTGMPRDDAPDFRDGSINVNVVLRWEFQPGSTIVGVYTRGQSQVDYDSSEGSGRPRFSRFVGGPGTDLFLLKLSLLLM